MIASYIYSVHPKFWEIVLMTDLNDNTVITI